MHLQEAFSVLELDLTASEDDIRAAWKRLARLYHPDLNNGDVAKAERFKQVNEAYNTIRDLKKSGYDAKPHTPHPGNGNSDADFFRRASNFRWGNHSEQRQQETKREQQYHSGAGQAKEDNASSSWYRLGSNPVLLRVTVPVSYHLISSDIGFDTNSIKATSRKSHMNFPHVCPTCMGYGVLSYDKQNTRQFSCMSCGGTGKSAGETQDFLNVQAKPMKVEKGGVCPLLREITEPYVTSTILMVPGVDTPCRTQIIWVPVFPTGTWMQGNDLHIHRKTNGKCKFMVKLWHGRKVRVTLPKEIGVLGATIRLHKKGMNGGDCYIHASPLV